MSTNVDIYSVDFTNKFVSSVSTISGEGTIFINLGGTLYKGVEG